MEAKKIAPRLSRVIAHCGLCGDVARVVCVECKQGFCRTHASELGNMRCLHNRKQHNDASLRLLSEGGLVESDEVTFFS